MVKKDSFIYLSFFFFFSCVCVCVRFIKIEKKGILIVRVRFSFQTHSLRQIKWFYCSSRMSYSYVMNVPFFGGEGELKRKEAERIFELVFNFSVLTTARLLEGYIDNESMF